MVNKKIISLLPAATEIICGLGLEDQLVGRSHECNYPETVKKLPACTTSRIMGEMSSEEINEQVVKSLYEALSLYKVDRDLINSLGADIIITQDQCKVCAVSINDLEGALQRDNGKEVEVISLHPSVLEDIFVDIKRIGDQTGVTARAELYVEDLRERIDLVKHKLRFVEDRPSVACIEWLSPLMVAGNWTPELIGIAGGRPVLAEAGKHSPFVDFDQIKEQNPDIIIVAACGFTIERTLSEIDVLLQLPGWGELEAVKNNKVYIADGDRYFNRSGPSVVDTIEMLAEIIQPKQFVFGFEGKAWLRFGV